MAKMTNELPNNTGRDIRAGEPIYYSPSAMPGDELGLIERAGKILAAPIVVPITDDAPRISWDNPPRDIAADIQRMSERILGEVGIEEKPIDVVLLTRTEKQFVVQSFPESKEPVTIDVLMGLPVEILDDRKALLRRAAELETQGKRVFFFIWADYWYSQTW